jgi:hypothetical protein
MHFYCLKTRVIFALYTYFRRHTHYLQEKNESKPIHLFPYSNDFAKILREFEE